MLQSRIQQAARPSQAPAPRTTPSRAGTVITVGDVDVPRAAIARLASALTHGGYGGRLVGYRLGQAIDVNRESLTLGAADAEAILDALAAHPIAELEPLGDALKTALRNNVKHRSALV